MNKTEVPKAGEELIQARKTLRKHTKSPKPRPECQMTQEIFAYLIANANDNLEGVDAIGLLGFVEAIVGVARGRLLITEYQVEKKE